MRCHALSGQVGTSTMATWPDIATEWLLLANSLMAGHLVLFSHSSSPIGFDLGILFHAKEHPVEFTNRIGPMQAVCSPETGGERDPRRGTKLSITCPDFCDRNFLWLLSLNSTFRIRVCKDSKRVAESSLAWELLAPGAAGSRFFTIDESHFGLQLGSLCYLPKGHDPAFPAPCQAQQTAEAVEDILCSPCHGFPADWHLARELRRCPDLTEMEALKTLPAVDADLLQLLRSSEDVSAQSAQRRKRLQRLGTPEKRRRLCSCAEQAHFACNVMVRCGVELFFHIL